MWLLGSCFYYLLFKDRPNEFLGHHFVSMPLHTSTSSCDVCAKTIRPWAIFSSTSACVECKSKSCDYVVVVVYLFVYRMQVPVSQGTRRFQSVQRPCRRSYQHGGVSWLVSIPIGTSRVVYSCLHRMERGITSVSAV